MIYTPVNFAQWLDHSQGTYAAYKLSAESAKALNDWFMDTLNEGIKAPDSYHCTLIMSHNPFPQLEQVYIPVPVTATPTGISIFGTENDYIVLELESQQMQEAYDICAAMGAKSDWPTYHPHVTLVSHVDPKFDYKINRLDVTKLPPMIFDKVIVSPLKQD